MDARPGTAAPERSWRLNLALVCLGGLLCAFGASSITVPLPQIAGDLNTSTGAASAAVIVYLLVLSGLFLFFGKLGDVWGYRRVFLAGTGAFAFGSLLCGLSYTVNQLIVFRILQAVGATMIASVVLPMSPAMSRNPGTAGVLRISRGRQCSVSSWARRWAWSLPERFPGAGYFLPWFPSVQRSQPLAFLPCRPAKRWKEKGRSTLPGHASFPAPSSRLSLPSVRSTSLGSEASSPRACSCSRLLLDACDRVRECNKRPCP